MSSELAAAVQEQVRRFRSVAVVGEPHERQRVAAQLQKLGLNVAMHCYWVVKPEADGLGGEVHPLSEAGWRRDLVLITASGPTAVYAAGRLRAMGCAEVYAEPEFYARLQTTAWLAQALPALGVLWDRLADEPSRRTLLGVVRFRLTLDAAALVVAPYPQYFHPQAGPRKNDLVVDAGAFTGDTAALFAQAAGPEGQVLAFEPSPASFAKLQEMAGSAAGGRIVPVQAGLWSRDSQVSFQVKGRGSSGDRPSADGGAQVPMVSLDGFCRSKGLTPTLIKMDVEGAEGEALAGAEETIRRCRPRLQICVYHKLEDLWQIPLWLSRVNPDYRLYLGHHHPEIHWETVLYAV